MAMRIPKGLNKKQNDAEIDGLTNGDRTFIESYLHYSLRAKNVLWRMYSIKCPFWAAAPKGSVTYAFKKPPGPYLSLEAHIPASRPISQPQGPNPSLEAQIPREWNLGLGIGIWALRVGSGPQDWDMGLQSEKWAWRLGEGRGYGEKEGGGGENSPYV